LLPDEESAPTGFGWAKSLQGSIDEALTEDWVVASAQYGPDGWRINQGSFPQRVFITFPAPNPGMTVTSASFQYQGQASLTIPNSSIACDTSGCTIDWSVFSLYGEVPPPLTLAITVVYSTSTATGLSVSKSFPVKLADPWF
jgi:hypothetical protein